MKLLEGSRCAGYGLVGPQGRGRSTGRGRMSGAKLRGRSASGHPGGEEGPDWWALAVRHCGRGARWLGGEVAPTSGAGLSGRTRASGRGSCAGRGERAEGVGSTGLRCGPGCWARGERLGFGLPGKAGRGRGLDWVLGFGLLWVFYFSFLFLVLIQTKLFEFKQNLNSTPMHSNKIKPCTSMNATKI